MVFAQALAPTTPAVNFPKPFQCYKPQSHKVYGSICISPTNRVLVVKGRRSGKWSFPKGHKNGSESYIDCALRETREETGLDLSTLSPMAYHKLSAGEYYFYEVEREEAPEIRDCGEVEDAGWFTLEEVAQMPCNVDVSYFLSRMNRSYRRKAGRPQEGCAALA
jgi:8-oxo-dGTP pyrophosphatase MutT (NUDIX family)